MKKIYVVTVSFSTKRAVSNPKVAGSVANILLGVLFTKSFCCIDNFLVRWEEQTRKAMNLYEEKKQKEGLTEVIYATCDGNIYFLDLEDGTATRDKISLGFPVKGTGSLYPSGIPLYFVKHLYRQSYPEPKLLPLYSNQYTLNQHNYLLHINILSKLLQKIPFLANILQLQELEA